MKKVVYVITSLAHKRVFESFVERDDLDQYIIGTAPKITSSIVPEDYSDYNIKNVLYYNDKKELQKIINKISPDVYVSASLPITNGILIKDSCKKVYVSHGLIGNHVIGLIKKAGFDTSVWQGCDLYCGAGKPFYDWVKRTAKVSDDKILLNAIPQLDLLFEKNYCDSYKKIVMSRTKNPEADKVILFVGFEGKERVDFLDHNEDYFWSVIELEKIARKNNWLVMVKPRHTFSYMINFLSKNRKWGWPNKYIEAYKSIQDSKYLHFITTTGHIYRYFFCDAVVLNGTSTVEIESLVAKKPLTIIRTKVDKEKYDPFLTVNSNISKYVDKKDPIMLEQKIKESFCYNCENYDEFVLKNYGIVVDGKMHETIQNKILQL